VIKALPPDKAPRLDDFTARLLQATWPVIRHELMSAFDAFCHLDTRGFHNINEEVMTLLPKSAEATGIGDYHRISLIHTVVNLFSKVLANRLTPKLNELVHISQSAFYPRMLHPS
jgi:hypothetical protein